MVDFCYQSDEKSHILFTSLCSIFNGTEMDRNIRIIFPSGLDFIILKSSRDRPGIGNNARVYNCFK
jgi:hypothetical protein